MSLPASNERTLVRHVCTAYESGFGHGADGRDLGNPYVPLSSAWEAYQYGHEEGLKRRSSGETPCDAEPVLVLIDDLIHAVNVAARADAVDRNRTRSDANEARNALVVAVTSHLKTSSPRREPKYPECGCTKCGCGQGYL